MQTEVWKVALSADAMRSLSPQSRYVFALTGHVFNELLLLQKWVHISRRAPGSPGPQEDAGVGVTMFLVKLLSAKVYEALSSDVLTKKSVEEVLRADYFGKVQGLNEKWDAALDQYKTLEWLSWVRNKVGFHYMNATQWAPGLEDSVLNGAYVYVGKRYSDTYFHWSEMTAALPAMKHVNAAEPFLGLEQMVSELGALMSDVTDCLAIGLQAFMKEIKESISEPIRFESPLLEPPALHYFFADERLGK